jgi:hypothetical protein
MIKVKKADLTLRFTRRNYRAVLFYCYWIAEQFPSDTLGPTVIVHSSARDGNIYVYI